MTPQAPVLERPPAQPSTPPVVPLPTPTPQPAPWQVGQPVNWQLPYPQAQAPMLMPSTIPTAGHRLALAITSLALLIPLVAIALNFPVSLGAAVPIWLSITMGLLGALIMSLLVLAVNLVFNWDVLRPRR